MDDVIEVYLVLNKDGWVALEEDEEADTEFMSGVLNDADKMFEKENDLMFIWKYASVLEMRNQIDFLEDALSDILSEGSWLMIRLGEDVDDMSIQGGHTSNAFGLTLERQVVFNI